LTQETKDEITYLRSRINSKRGERTDLSRLQTADALAEILYAQIRLGRDLHSVRSKMDRRRMGDNSAYPWHKDG